MPENKVFGQAEGGYGFYSIDFKRLICNSSENFFTKSVEEDLKKQIRFQPFSMFYRISIEL